MPYGTGRTVTATIVTMVIALSTASCSTASDPAPDPVIAEDSRD